jgi:hypothetical protein
MHKEGLHAVELMEEYDDSSFYPKQLSLFPGVEPFPYVLGWRIALSFPLLSLNSCRKGSDVILLSLSIFSISKPASLL